MGVGPQCVQVIFFYNYVSLMNAKTNPFNNDDNSCRTFVTVLLRGLNEIMLITHCTVSVHSKNLIGTSLVA